MENQSKPFVFSDAEQAALFSDIKPEGKASPAPTADTVAARIRELGSAEYVVTQEKTGDVVTRPGTWNEASEFVEKYATKETPLLIVPASQAGADCLDNKWVKELRGRGLALTAENCLSIMRDPFELLLAWYAITGAPSQSHRGSRLLDQLERDSADPGVPFQTRLRMGRDKRFIRDFLAVHRAVYILEGRVL